MYEQLVNILGRENVFCQEELSAHTTLKIGGPAKYFVKVNNKDCLLKLLNLLEENNEKYYVLGNGSNVLVSDEGYDGVIIHLSGEFEIVNATNNKITAGAAALLSLISKTAMENALTGLEFASGIPGTLGGALVMNAGAYGGEMVQVVSEVTVLEKQISGCYKEVIYSCEDMHFSYRHSVAKEKQVIFLDATLSLLEGNKDSIKASMDEMNKSRREKQPLEYPSAGSTFKRPVNNFAGKLISDAGLKGYSVGGAQVSEKHAGFCINKGGATAADFIKLMEDVSSKVENDYGVKLEPEVIFLGK